MDTFASRLESARKRIPLTQAELAERAGVTRVTIARLESNEKGTAPRPATLRAIAAALDVSATWLLYGEVEDYPKIAA